MPEILFYSEKVFDFLCDVSLRALAVGLMALTAAWLLRRRGPEMRHAVWVMALAAMIALPVLTLVLPRAYVLPELAPATVWQSLPLLPGSPATSGSVPVSPPSSASVPVPAPQSPRNAAWPLLFIAAYLALATSLLLRVALSVRRARMIVESALTLRDPSLLSTATEVALSQGTGFPLPRLCEAATVSVPFAAGWQDPAIVLPVAWREWDDFRLRAVLAHEMAHIRRGDWLVSVLAAANSAVSFFHPLAWWLERRLAALAEEACDASAIAATGDPRRYAAVLFDFASLASDKVLPATAMARSSLVGARIERLLTTGLAASRRVTPAMWVLAALCALPVLYGAAALSIGQAPAPPTTVQRSEHNPILGLPIPGANLSAPQAAELEQRLANNAHDLDARTRLLGYYYSNAFAEPWLHHLLWSIENHPEAAIHDTYQSMVAADRSMIPDDATYRKVQDLWRRKAAENPSNPDVLLHAAKFLERIDRSECLRLREAARAAAPADPRPLNLLSGMWIGELFWLHNGSPEQNQRAAEALPVLLQSHDADLVGQVGLFMRPKDLQRLFEVNPQYQERFRASLRRQLDACERLLERAAQLDPQNPKWPEALREIRAGLPAA